MAILTRTSTLEPIREKIEAGERLDFEDGLALLETDDLLGLGELADRARRLRGGTDEVYFVQNLYLNQTNVCRVKCKFCAFAATQKQEHAYTISTQELVEDAVRQRELTGFTEIHMVNGENPHVDFEFYVDAVRSLKQALPDVHLKMYTASEIHHMTVLSGLTHEEVLRELKAAGLGSLPGGGAEVFADRVRKLVAPGKEHPTTGSAPTMPRTGWGSRRTARCSTAMSRPTRSGSTTSSGCAAQQDETGGFLAFIPLAFHPENTVFERRGWRHTTGSDDLKMLAVSRLLLDNIANIKAYWIMMGMPLAAVALHFGANDVQGTVVREQIFHAAGAVTETEQKIEELVRFVRRGRIPVQRDTLYNELRRWTEAKIPLSSRNARCGRLECLGVKRSERADLVREHGAGLPPPERRGGGGAGCPDRAERLADRRAARSRPDLLDRVRTPRVVSADPAPDVRLLGGRGRLDPARLEAAVRVDPLDRRDAGECDLRRALEGAAPERGPGSARGEGRREAPDRRRGAEERVRGPDAPLRPREAVARADRAADGLRRLGGTRAGRRTASRSSSTRSSRAFGLLAPSPTCSRTRRASATAIPPAISLVTSRSSATRSARANGPASTPSSRWPATWASSSTSPSSASSAGATRSQA